MAVAFLQTNSRSQRPSRAARPQGLACTSTNRARLLPRRSPCRVAGKPRATPSSRRGSCTPPLHVMAGSERWGTAGARGLRVRLGAGRRPRALRRRSPAHATRGGAEEAGRARLHGTARRAAPGDRGRPPGRGAGSRARRHAVRAHDPRALPGARRLRRRGVRGRLRARPAGGEGRARGRAGRGRGRARGARGGRAGGLGPPAVRVKVWPSRRGRRTSPGWTSPPASSSTGSGGTPSTPSSPSSTSR
jgi:hypothetical protein